MTLHLSKVHAAKLRIPRAPRKTARKTTRRAPSKRKLAETVSGKKVPRVHKQLSTLKLILRGMNVDFAEEHRFHPTRMWRFDLAIPSHKLAIEYQGHGQTGRNAGTGDHIGSHATIKGLSNDCEKDLQATLLGWRVLKLTALHFSARDRAKHNLTSPLEAIQSLLSLPSLP